MLKEQKKRKRYKHSGFDGTTLICCAIGVVVSVNSCNFVNEKIASAREAAKRAQVRIQSQSIQTEELVIPDSLDEIQQKLLGNKQEIALQGNKESEDSYNAEYEAELATEPAESEDSYNEEVGNEILEETAESQTKADTMTESEIEKENSIFVSSSYSESDYELLCEITYAEAGNQTEEQQVAAAATILNRVGSSISPNTIKEVIMQRGQFASTKNGHIYACGKTVDFSKLPDMTKEAARRALNGEDPTENWLRKEAKRLGLNSEKYASGGALYFYSPEFTSSSELVARSNIKCKVQKGGHVFYKVWG